MERTKEQILQQLGWTVTNGNNQIMFDLIISQAMDVWAEQKLKNLNLAFVSGSSEADYWSERCKLMENIEEENPFDPDITEKQINAWSKYHNFIKEKGQRNYR